jgi:hydroxyacylglutathione hydrolase
MIFKRFYNDKLAQASFLVGDSDAKEALILDPNRHFEQYLEAAAAEGLEIVAVAETHIHADYLSGSYELAKMAGAQLYVSDEGDEEWKYGFGKEPNVTLLRHGGRIQVGKVRLDAVHTPGHTPEHLSFVLTDEKTAELPLGVFTGDFLFVGDVGRPDLLERAANYKGTMEKGAKTLYASIQSFRDRSGEMMLWPAHGAGSACGKSLGGVPFSTLAYERVANWALKAGSEEEFVQGVLEGQPDPPAYFKHMKRLNRDGPPLLGTLQAPRRLPGQRILETAREKATLLDVRPYGEVGTGYVKEALNIPADKAFLTWSGWLVPYDRPIFLIASDADMAEDAARDLALIGLDDVQGWYGQDGLRAYEIEHGTLPITPQASIEEAYRRSQAGEAHLLDVRTPSEWNSGRAPGAIHIPLGYLPDRTDEVPTDKPVYVHCGGGIRSAIASSVLHRAGIRNVINIPGGFYEYKELGLPVEKEKEPAGV